MIDFKWERIGKFADDRGLMVIVQAEIELECWETHASPAKKWIEVSRKLETLSGQPCRPIHRHGDDVELIYAIEVMTPLGAVEMHKVND